MKRFLLKYLIALIVFAAFGTVIFFAVNEIFEGDSGRRNTLMNRFAQAVEEYPSDDTAQAVEAVRAQEESSWKDEYGKANVPYDITFIPAGSDMSGKITEDSGSRVIWAIRHDGDLAGFAVFSFPDNRKAQVTAASEAVIASAFIFIVIYFIYIDRKVLLPFNRLSDYPEKIANNETGEHIPETKERYFGKYIWGMNMLSDRLSGDRRKLRTLEKEKQTLLSSIAHGIKTPVANIRLYCEAIRSGLYRKDGIPDPDDASVAQKISKNTDDIESLVKELLDSASKGIVEYEPSVEPFYLSSIEDWLNEEYANRLNVLKIPFEIDCRSRVMFTGDRSGVIRILTQFMENAIKYGDGKRIGALIDKNEDGYIFTVSNTGSRVPEGEERYIFNSFWRGSNAENVEGNGLGLYEASYIARKLGGAVACRYNEQTSETEFSVFFPL